MICTKLADISFEHRGTSLYSQISRCKKEAVTADSQVTYTWVHSTHTQSNTNSQLFSIKMFFVLECQSSCLAETSQAGETWLQCSPGIDSTGVPRRWQGQQLIGPKWERRGRLIVIDPLLPPAGSSIFDYDHFAPNQVCVNCDGEIPLRGISSICKGCNYERIWGPKVNAWQVPSGWLDNNRAFSCLPLQFSHIDNRV